MSGPDSRTRTSVTIRDVARVADVHVSTVSRALDPRKSSLVSPATRARVLAVADEMQYRPDIVASGLRRRQTRTVGVIVSDIGNPLNAPLTRGLTHALDLHGYMPLLADTEDDPRRFERILLQLVTGRRVDAVVTTAARTRDQAVLQSLARHGVPIVLALRKLPASGFAYVVHDDEAGATLAAKHLLALGHQRFAQVAGPQDVEGFRARSSAFERAVLAAGGHLLTAPSAAEQPTVQEGERVMRELLAAAGSPPTAVFAQNDMMALGAISVLRQAGLSCPEDVSVVGYNDTLFSPYSAPSLTTVRLPAYEVGERAGAMALAYIQAPGVLPASVTIPASLVVRGSTASAPAGSRKRSRNER
jgi:LacI family transcriptional regulator